MLRFFARICVRVGAMAAMVLLASVVLAPSNAEAACGDYVTVNGKDATMDHAIAGNSQHDMPLSRDPAVPRCHGPHCSNGSFPPATPTPKLEVRVDELALPNCVEISLSPEPGSLLAAPREVPCAGHGLSILRPPR